MLRTNLARAVVALRRHHGWRQSDLARRASVSRQVVSRVERGDLAGVPMRTVGRLVEALDATAHLTVRWRGEELDRLADAAHAHVVESASELLRAHGWVTRVEVSFNHYGDRGRVDVLATHPATRHLLVVEAKSAIGDLQEMLGRLDVKCRLAPMLAQSAGWDEPSAVVRALVIADTRTARRVVDRHAAMLSTFSLRGRAATAWVRRPHGAEPLPSGLLWFVPLPRAHQVSITRSGRVRL